ncbi:MAG: hypothetical protein IT354_06960, partial [Gemmatimonadaceae bacterium]|nr:hypothetical protein [Gemmatimonadaceae bacterium]
MTILPRGTRLVVFLSAMLVGAVAQAQAQAHDAHHSAPNAAGAAVVQAIRALFAAAERGDLTALDSLYAGDSLLVIEGAGMNRGWADYRDN